MHVGWLFQSKNQDSLSNLGRGKYLCARQLRRTYFSLENLRYFLWKYALWVELKMHFGIELNMNYVSFKLVSMSDLRSRSHPIFPPIRNKRSINQAATPEVDQRIPSWVQGIPTQLDTTIKSFTKRKKVKRISFLSFFAWSHENPRSEYQFSSSSVPLCAG